MDPRATGTIKQLVIQHVRVTLIILYNITDGVLVVMGIQLGLNM